jgi:predicted Zn-dependent protease
MATTRGCAREHASTLASFRVWALETPGAGGPAGSGTDLHLDLGALRLEEETERAVRACRDGRDPLAIEPGTYDVVMEPEAVAELLEWLGAIAFAAPEVEQGTSAIAGRLGDRLTGDAVTLWDDPLSEEPGLGFGVPFDREGTSRRRVTLLERGVARAVLHDRTTAARAGATSTASALLPGPGSEGGVGATSLSLAAGTAASVDDLVGGLERGLYVRRLHYVNGLVDPRRTVMTGLTRDGCFLVERGRVRRAVRNLRFTESLLDALGRADGTTRGRKAVATAWSDDGVVVTPAVRMRAFGFRGDG